MLLFFWGGRRSQGALPLYKTLMCLKGYQPHPLDLYLQFPAILHDLMRCMLHMMSGLVHFTSSYRSVQVDTVEV
jgi:hypothetical protein